MKTRIPTPEQVAAFLMERLRTDYEAGSGHRHDFNIEMDFEDTEESLSIRGIYLLDYTEDWDETGYYVYPGADGVIVSVANMYSYHTGEEIEIDPHAVQEAYNRESLRINSRNHDIGWLMDRIDFGFFEEDPDRRRDEVILEAI